jgi:UDP-N-acetylmuramate dehydrogenase
VRDGGLRGAVILTHGAFSKLEPRADGLIWCEAGVPCARIARHCVRLGLGPAEFFAGIPGTLGGALAMNAGAFGGETWSHVREVEVIDRSGNIRWRAAGEYRVAYRHVTAPVAGEAFLGATLAFESRPASNNDTLRDLLVERSAGLKGRRIGGACVSPKHANFIINEGEASAADLEQLICEVRDVVEARFGVRLQTEVRIVGEAA